MKKIIKTIDINAPKEKVWDILFGKETYKVWTAPFSSGSNSDAVTDWNEGSDVKFVDGSGSGIAGKIVKHVPNETIRIQYYGPITNNNLVTEGDEAEQWKGTVEEYRISERDGVSRFDVSCDMLEPYFDFMSKAWDEALAILKKLSEEK